MTKITRGEFLAVARRILYSIGGIAIIGPVFAYFFPASLEEMPSEPVLVGKTEDLPTGESKTVRFGRYPALIIHTPDGLRAYSAVCTHFACIVKWDAELGQIVCPCHEATSTHPMEASSQGHPLSRWPAYLCRSRVAKYS